MTTEKMPNVIWADVDSVLNSIGDWSSTKSECYNTRYLRAEPVEELLKHVRESLDFYASKRQVINAGEYGGLVHFRPEKSLDSINAIDKFLGEK